MEFGKHPLDKLSGFWDDDTEIEIEQTFQCQNCKEEFTGEEYDNENGECPECEVKLIEI